MEPNINRNRAFYLGSYLRVWAFDLALQRDAIIHRLHALHTFGDVHRYPLLAIRWHYAAERYDAIFDFRFEFEGIGCGIVRQCCPDVFADFFVRPRWRL